MYTLYTNIHTYIYESLTKAASSVLLVILSPGHSAPALALIREFNKNVLNKHKCERTNHVLFTSHITIYIHVLVLTLVELEDIYLALNISMQIYRHGYAFIFNYRCCFVNSGRSIFKMIHILYESIHGEIWPWVSGIFRSLKKSIIFLLALSY